MLAVGKLDGPVDARGLVLAVEEAACERGRHALVEALLVEVEGVLEGGGRAGEDGWAREDDACAKAVEGLGVVREGHFAAGGGGGGGGGVGELGWGGGHTRGDGHDVGRGRIWVGGCCCGGGRVGAA